MMKVEQILELDLHGSERIPELWAKQGDVRSRFVRVRLLCDGAPFQIPERTIANFRCLKPDGYSCMNPAQIHEDGTLTVELTDQVLAESGVVWADVFLLSELGEMLSTVSFKIHVDFVPVGLQGASTNEVLTLMELIRRAEAVEDGASAYEIAVEHGYEGTEEDWLASLKGENGEPGKDGEDGETGAQGPAGYTPVKGVDYFTMEEQQQLREDVLDALPVQVASDGFTDLTGLRQVTQMSFARSEDYVLVQTVLEGGKTDVTVVSLDENGYPDQIQTGENSCILSWEGFEEAALEGWEGGSY